MPLTETTWLVSGSLPGALPYRLAVEPLRAMMTGYLEPSRTRIPEWQAFYRGSYGPGSNGPNRRAWLPQLCWGESCNAAVNPETTAEFTPPEFAAPSMAPADWRLVGGSFVGLELADPTALRQDTGLGAGATPTLPWLLLGSEVLNSTPEMLAVVRGRPCPSARTPRPVRIVRYAGETERLELTDCDGAIASDALERLSVLARPPNTARPELPLPLHPQGELGEWMPELRLLHPRLAWLVSRIAEAFPQRSIVLMSGYRRDAHSGLHQKGQALDLYVQGVPNEDLFRFCRTLSDAGCGFYPNHPFVHVDVRSFGKGHVTWVDVSDPGEQSVYVDGWPGVLAPGIGWLGPRVATN
ncbi:MAG TPA: DUF882 domain-containing protein [Polyangiaceae bacterium]|nr:DUF882 domain-containing protein [Polyangiaceae bacterium]